MPAPDVMVSHKLSQFSPYKKVTKHFSSKSGSKAYTDIFNHMMDMYLQNEDVNSEPVLGQCNCAKTSEPDFKDMLFICELKQLQELLVRVQEHNGSCQHTLSATDEQRDGHVSKVLLQCCVGHLILFESSSKDGEQYTANMYILLGHTCSGML